ncbi:MAG: hypothetical protein RLZZ191_1728 [Pseudomonadota bacterium]
MRVGNDRQNVIPPDIQRAVFKCTFALTATRIIEPQHANALRLCPSAQRRCLATLHIGHIARQKNKRRSAAVGQAIGQFYAVMANGKMWC